MKTSVNTNNIESKNVTRKAASKNTRKALCDELCTLLGYQTWKIKTQAGSRDWAGIYDYSLVFDDGKELFISTSSRKDLFDIQVRELIDGFKRTSKEGIKPGDWVKTNSGRVAKVVRVSKEWEDHCAMLYLKESGVAPRNDGYVEIHNLICAADEVTIITAEDLKPTTDVKDDYKSGDRVRHNQSGREATVTDIRVTKEMKAFGELRKVYRLDFGETVLGPFGYDLNGGEFIAEAITELLPEPPKEIVIEDVTFFDEQSGKAEREPASEITDENEAARALAGKEAHFVISDKDGRETLSHSFTFKDSFRNQANRIWIDIKEKGDVIGRWMMLKYDVIKDLANTGRVVVSHPDGERHCITLA